MAESGTTKTHFISDRLALIILPANPKPIKAKAQKKLSRKATSALKNFLDLPLDIIYETFAYLEPLDLLTLARLSKDFRALFMSRSSLSIWRRVLNDVSNLPQCPQDMCEPQYASLVFDKFCMACGSTRGSIDVDFKTRLRFCATCARANLTRGYSLRTNYDMDQVRTAATIIPFSSPEYGYFDSTPEDYSSINNGLGLIYFKPELEQALEELRALAMSKDGYDQFLAEQQVIATRMIKEGQAMQLYKDELMYAQEELAEAVTNRRYQRIQEEMESLGWDTELYSPEQGEDDFVKWEEYMFQPKEFTARGWLSIRPKLAAIYHRTRRNRLIEDLIRRAWGEYLSFRESQKPEVRRTLPPWADICEFDFLAEFCRDNYEECSDEDIEKLMVQIVATSSSFAARVEHELAHIIARADRTQKFACNAIISEASPVASPSTSVQSNTTAPSANAEPTSNDKGKAKAEADPTKSAKEILGLACNVFLCQCYLCSERRAGATRVFAYPDVVNHVIDNATIAKSWVQLKPQTRLEGINAARDILAALGLAEDCTRTEVLALGDFVCSCGHYRFEGPLSYDRLVTHVYEQQMWDKCLLLNVDPASEHLVDDLIVNGHSRERLRELMRVATDEDRPKRTDEDDDSAASQDSVETLDRVSDIAPGMYCRYCYRLELEGNIVRNEMMAYHVKYRHGKESQYDDFEELTVLADEYGEREDDMFFPFPFPFFSFA